MKFTSFPAYIACVTFCAALLFSPACKDDPPDDPPVEFRAGFSAASPHGVMPFTAQFLDETTGEPIAWRWDFQNDSITDDTTRNPWFTYPDPGFYSVGLIAEDADEADTVVKVHYISVTTDAIGLVYQGSITASIGEEIAIPVSLSEPVGLGALTLKLIYDYRRIRMIGYENGALSGVQSIIDPANGIVSFAWSSALPVNIPAGSELISLRAEILDEIDSTMRHTVIGNPVEFADPNAVVLQGLHLRFPKVHSQGK